MIEIYYFIIAVTIILGMILPQEEREKKTYIALMAILHTFICGFRYKFLTGDLLKYEWNYRDLLNYGWFSEKVINEGKNTGFQMFMKLISTITNGEFQYLLIIIALVTEIVLAVMIYRYSPKPWLSYLIWNCIGFYIFGFSAIKQALAMAFIMCAMMAIMEDNLKKFMIFTLIASFIHMPAIAFLPAYWLAKNKINSATILGYIFSYIVIFVFRNQLVSFFGNIYYEDEAMELFQNSSEALGGRFFIIILTLLCGIVLKGFKEREFQKLFNMIVVAAILQMFSGVDNIFTRFADYYFQMAVLYIPLIFYDLKKNVTYNKNYAMALLPFNTRSIKVFIAILTVILVWYYYYTCLGTTIAYEVDNYLNYRFMWSVQ